MTTPLSINDASEWDTALASLPPAHVLQSWAWGQFKARHGWTPLYLAWQGSESGTPWAGGLVLRRQLGRWPLPMLYVPKGPALDYDNLDQLEAVLAGLERLARRQGAMCLKIDPDVPQSRQDILVTLKRRGWQPSRQQIQFRNTMIIDLTQDDETLLAGMHAKTRYNIRLAARKDVSVRPGGLDDLDELYAMYEETAQRDGFIIRPRAYYRDVWGNFIQAGLGQALIAQVEGQAVAGLVLFHFGATAYYFYGMSRDLHRNRMPNYLLQWEAMRWARQAGCTRYDLWGAPDQLDESDPMYGVYRFKQGLGARFVAHIGAWDYAAWRPLYWLYSVAMPRLVEWMHRRHVAHPGQPQGIALGHE